MRAAHFDAAFFLNCRGVKNLVGMRSLREATRDFQHDGAADAVVPCFGEIAIVGEHGEVGNGDDGITGRDAEGSDIGGGARAGVEIKILLLRLALRVRGDVRVPNVGDGEDGTL